MSETTATSDFRVLGDATSSTEAAVKRAQRLALRYRIATSTFSLSWIVWRLIISTRRPLRTLCQATANLPVETDEDRELVRELAARVAETTRNLEEIYNSCKDVGRSADYAVPFTAPVLRWTTGQLEDLLCTLEDTAETLALSASKPFAQLIRRELDNAQPSS